MVKKCNQCDYASSQADDLRIRLKTHNGENSNKCNYASSHSGYLRKHLKVYTGKKSHKCNQCNYVSSHTGVFQITSRFENTQWSQTINSQTIATNVTLLALTNPSIRHNHCRSNEPKILLCIPLIKISKC